MAQGKNMEWRMYIMYIFVFFGITERRFIQESV